MSILACMIYQDLLRFYLFIFFTPKSFVKFHNMALSPYHHHHYILLCVYFEAESMAIFFSQNLVEDI